MSVRSFIKAGTLSILATVVLIGCSEGGGSGSCKLVTEASPKDGGSVSRDINQEIYPAGTNVTLTAEATPGYVFKEWRGAISGNTRTISVATVGNMKVTAVFEKETIETITIGDMTWMNKNLNVETDGSCCYDNDPSNCEKYGRLYTWEAAQNACAGLGAGWRLPSDADWTALENAVGGSSIAGRKLKSRAGWANNGNGTDEFGFSALPSGYRPSNNFSYVGYYGFWWSATERDAWHARARGMRHDVDASVGSSWNYKSGGLSVRCIRDN